MTGNQNSDVPEHREGASQSGDQAPAQTEAAPIDLAARVAELEAQVADLTDRLLRAHAEMENVRKRTERDKAETAKYAISRFAHDMVAVFDNFQRAVAAVPAGAAEQDPALKTLLDGVTMTERAALKVLEAHGVRRIDSQGELFNPHLHQAVMEQENAEVPAGTVLQVLQAGYVIEDRVLRPAMVVTAKGGPKPAKLPETPAPAPANDDRPVASDATTGTQDPKQGQG
ncbi:MAG TPA: nucleotide exchange factor GrpE [Hyphomicrobiaceae bacterium]|nr:nucleotide exchange factor GrpE [Hyphomicrobiaceae bacterium]